MCEIPLTLEQQAFAAEHHDLIYRFLRAHYLPIDEFYDIAVFGYLSAVREYLTRANLQSKSFTTIGWKAMAHSLNKYFEKQQAQKRDAETVCIHTLLSREGDFSPGTTGMSDYLTTQLEINLLLHDLAKQVSKQQMEIVRLKYHGYSNSDIAKKQKISLKRVQKLLKEVRHELAALCHE